MTQPYPHIPRCPGGDKKMDIVSLSGDCCESARKDIQSFYVFILQGTARSSSLSTREAGKKGSSEGRQAYSSTFSPIGTNHPGVPWMYGSASAFSSSVMKWIADARG
jgi:hypothetical protein